MEYRVKKSVYSTDFLCTPLLSNVMLKNPVMEFLFAPHSNKYLQATSMISSPVYTLINY